MDKDMAIQFVINDLTKGGTKNSAFLIKILKAIIVLLSVFTYITSVKAVRMC